MINLKRRFLGIRLRWWLAAFFVSPVVLVGILNLIFATAWGTGFLERKMEAKLGLPCRIDQVSWSPWAGVQIKDFQVLPPEGSVHESSLIEIERVTVDPSWKSIFSRRKRWDRLEISSMRATVSLEVLKEIAARFQSRKILEANGQVGPGDSRNPPLADTPGGKEDSGTGSKEVPEGADPAGQADLPESPVADKAVPKDDFEGEIILKDCSLKFFSVQVPEAYIELRGVSGDLPIWGKERGGELKVGELNLGPRFTEKDLTFPISWISQNIRLKPHSLELFGLDLEVSAALRVSPGLPMGFQIDIPDQQVDLSSVYLEEKPPLSIGHLLSRSVVKGYLLMPRSFQGQSETTFRELVFHDLRDGGEMRFDRGSASLELSVAGLVAEDIRVIGEDDSVLMNGFATVAGEAAATVRVVSSPERADSHEQRIRGASEAFVPDFQPLVTPDREYRDVRVEVREGRLMMDLGVDRSWVPFFPAVKAILGSKTLEAGGLP